MKKKLFLKFFVLAVIGAFVTFTSCKDYDDDINDLSKQVSELKTQLDAINGKIDNGLTITNVEKVGGVATITFSDGKSIAINDGANGKDGSVIIIGENGNWFIDGEDTKKPSQGENGKDGVGSGIYYYPHTDGFWHKVEGDVDTATTQKWAAEGSITAVWDAENGVVRIKGIQGIEGEYILGAQVLYSLVYKPELFIGGVEAIAFRPLILNFSEAGAPGEATKPGCPLPEIDAPEIPCLEGLGETITVGAYKMQVLAPGKNIVKYNMNPSSVSAEMIDYANLNVTSHLASFRAGGVEDDMPNPYSAEFVGINKGEITVDMKLDLAKYAEVYGIEGIFGQADIPGFGYRWRGQNPVSALEVPHSQPALSKLPAGANPFITSDYTKTVVNPIVYVDIAKRNKKATDEVYEIDALLVDNLGKTETGNSDVAGIPAGDENAKQQHDGVNVGSVADHRIIELVEGQTLNLVDHITAVGGGWYEEELIGFNANDYGLTWSFDMLDGNEKPIKFELTSLKTEQQKFLKVTDANKGTIEAQVYGDTPTGAAVGRTPIVRVRLMAGDCVVSQSFIKVLIVKKGAVEDIKDLGSFTVDSNEGCEDAVHTMTVEQVNRNIYNKMNMSKEEFHRIYGPSDDNLDYEIYEDELENVDIKHLGKFGWVIDKDETGRSTYLPSWKIGACECDWGNETTKTIITNVFIAPLVKGYPTIKMTYTVVLNKPAIDFTNSDLNVAYWDDAFSFVKHHTAKPQSVTDADPANNTFETNINAAFRTHDNKLLKLGEEYVAYEYVFAPANEQIKKDINGKAITIDIENGGKELHATMQGYAKQMIASITDHTATDLVNPEGSDFLTYNKDSELAKFLLNQGIDFMWAKLNILAKCENACDGDLKVTIKGKEGFVVKFLRPINLNPTTTEKYIDGVDKGKVGSLLDITKISGLRDWRGDTFAANKNYKGFYGVSSITMGDRSDVKWDANGTLETVPSTVVIENLDKAAVTALNSALTTGTNYDDGGILYWNNNSTLTKDFYLYIPITVVYNWGTVVSETVKVKVDATTVVGN